MSRTPIFENAADSLRDGIASFLVRKESETAIKHAILGIYHSIELFLKERLAQIHPILIYRNLDKRIGDDAQTVGLAETVQRFENLDIPLSASHVKNLVELQRRRNRIEHHRFDPSADHEAVVGQCLKFILEFLPAHLDSSLEEILEEHEQYAAVRDVVLSYDERLADAIKQIEREAGTPMSRREHRGAKPAVVECPICGHETLLRESERGDFCFFCHQEVPLEECDNCGSFVASGVIDNMGLCDICRRHVFG
ncbi:MAG: hypothetical protein ACJ76N_23985 [Thermoanaerobaculia bacterium]